MAYTTIDNPEEHFVTTIWTGSGGAKTITGLEFKPDLIWTKTRSVGYNHMISDSTRGFNANSELGSNSTAVEGGLSAETYGYKSGHTSDGWTMVDGTDTVDSQEDGNTNQPSVTYVGWTWKANGGTTSSNSDGDITSTVQANTTAGFSIVTWTGNGTDEDTVGHGLSGNWDVAIVKNRGETDYWTFSRTGTSSVLLLHDSTNEANHSTAYLTKSSGVIGLVSAGDLGMVNGSSETYVAYVFKEIQGYSKFGSYTGNSNADGPFIYTGFKPAFLMWKKTNSADDWGIHDNKREESTNANPIDNYLRPNTQAVEGDDGDSVDFLSNGFKWRLSSGLRNNSGDTYIYIAFAETPFKYSNAR